MLVVGWVGGRWGEARSTTHNHHHHQSHNHHHNHNYNHHHPCSLLFQILLGFGAKPVCFKIYGVWFWGMTVYNVFLAVRRH